MCLRGQSPLCCTARIPCPFFDSFGHRYTARATRLVIFDRQAIDVKNEKAAWITGIWTQRVALIRQIHEEVDRYIEEDGVPPDALMMAWTCERYHALPVAGGILDQPDWLWEAMTEANAYYEKKKAVTEDDRIIQEQVTTSLQQRIREHHGL